MSDNQFGQQGCGCTSAIYMVQKTTEHFANGGSNAPLIYQRQSKKSASPFSEINEENYSE